MYQLHYVEVGGAFLDKKAMPRLYRLAQQSIGEDTGLIEEHLAFQ
jgi:hypothetical protein